MYKYIATLENLAPRFGTETFAVPHLEVRNDGDEGSSYLNRMDPQDDEKDNFTAPTTHEIIVSGIKGIRWRKVSVQVWKKKNGVVRFDVAIFVSLSFLDCNNPSFSLT